MAYKDEEFVSNFEDFADNAVKSKAELNYSDDDAAQANALKTALDAELNAMQAARTIYDAAAAAFKATRKTAHEFQLSRKKYFNANPNVSPAIKAMFSPQKNAMPNANTVNPPTNLIVNGFENGENLLKWERNGNPQYRIFIVESRLGEDGPWLFAGTTRRLLFVHKNQTPGVKMYYRVYAHTDDEQSSHSNTAVVYAN
jgi:hypothetical protein